MGRRAVLLAMVLGVLAAGCSDGDGADNADPTVPTAASTSSSTSAVADVSTIPDVIDEPYLNRVLAALDEVDGKATRIIYEKKDFVPEAAELLASVYGEEEFKNQTDAWLTALEDDPALESFPPNPPTRKTEVGRIIAASRECVWLAVLRRYPETGPTPAMERTEYVALQPIDRSSHPKSGNPTAWMIVADGFRRDGSEPSNPCPAS